MKRGNHAQVLPGDVDYRVMLTFLDFYHCLLQFALFRLYHSLGLRYPPQVDPRLEEAAAGLTAIMQALLFLPPPLPHPSELVCAMAGVLANNPHTSCVACLECLPFLGDGVRDPA
jgi:hypothetical protein